MNPHAGNTDQDGGRTSHLFHDFTKSPHSRTVGMLLFVSKRLVLASLREKKIIFNYLIYFFYSLFPVASLLACLPSVSSRIDSRRIFRFFLWWLCNLFVCPLLFELEFVNSHFLRGPSPLSVSFWCCDFPTAFLQSLLLGERHSFFPPSMQQQFCSGNPCFVVSGGKSFLGFFFFFFSFVE